MSRVKRMHQNPKHQEAEEALFMKRLCLKLDDEKPTKVDAVNLMQQLTHLYTALEKRIGEFSEQERKISFFALPPWNNRANLLQSDVEEMKGFLSDEESTLVDDEKFLYPATQAAIAKLKSCSPLELFAFLAVRTLGDVFGGQRLNDYNKQVFFDNNLTGAFYDRGKVVQRRLIINFINQKDLIEENEESTLDHYVDEVFQFHIDLFQEMEGCRRSLSLPLKPTQEKNGMSQCLRYTLFGFGVVAAAAGMAAVASSENNPWSFGNH